MLRWPDPLPRDARAQLMRVRIASQTKTYIRACVSLHARMRHAYICICPCNSSMRLLAAIDCCDFVLRLKGAITSCDSCPRLLAVIVGCDLHQRFAHAIRAIIRRDSDMRLIAAICMCGSYVSASVCSLVDCGIQLPSGNGNLLGNLPNKLPLSITYTRSQQQLGRQP